jgi:hypothetical protein
MPGLSHCSFALMQKNQKIKANAMLRRFALPPLPKCDSAFLFKPIA